MLTEEQRKMKCMLARVIAQNEQILKCVASPADGFSFTKIGCDEKNEQIIIEKTRQSN